MWLCEVQERVKCLCEKLMWLCEVGVQREGGGGANAGGGWGSKGACVLIVVMTCWLR